MAALIRTRYQKKNESAFALDMNGSATAVIVHGIGAGKANDAEPAATETLPDEIAITPVGAALFALPPTITAIDANSFTVTVDAADNARSLLIVCRNGFYK